MTFIEFKCKYILHIVTLLVRHVKHFIIYCYFVIQITESESALYYDKNIKDAETKIKGD